MAIMNVYTCICMYLLTYLLSLSSLQLMLVLGKKRIYWMKTERSASRE